LKPVQRLKLEFGTCSSSGYQEPQENSVYVRYKFFLPISHNFIGSSGDDHLLLPDRISTLTKHLGVVPLILVNEDHELCHSSTTFVAHRTTKPLHNVSRSQMHTIYCPYKNHSLFQTSFTSKLLTDSYSPQYPILVVEVLCIPILKSIVSSSSVLKDSPVRTYFSVIQILLSPSNHIRSILV
jgi:hypothetical protein